MIHALWMRDLLRAHLGRPSGEPRLHSGSRMLSFKDRNRHFVFTEILNHAAVT
jgi:hypothetical protein